jgi:N-methylhydantoinase B/oxoprolinase/acetone carboxylase alpha subunit
MGERRLLRLVTRYSVETVLRAVEDLTDYSEARMRKRIASETLDDEARLLPTKAWASPNSEAMPSSV